MTAVHNQALCHRQCRSRCQIRVGVSYLSWVDKVFWEGKGVSFCSLYYFIRFFTSSFEKSMSDLQHAVNKIQKQKQQHQLE
jgi:hypothetical protein